MTLTIQSHACKQLKGSLRPPGDKSISHRCVILGSLAQGRSQCHNLLLGEDVLATIEIFRRLGVNIDLNLETRSMSIHSPGLGLLEQPESVLDCENSGTCARLMAGVLASHPLSAILNGDPSLNQRPMRRIIDPLRMMGAQLNARQDQYLPLTIQGYDDLTPINYTLPVASAQIKSAILLAALNTRGVTTVHEPEICRDHTERILPQFGAKLEVKTTKQGRYIHCDGQHPLTPCDIDVPADISSAAFIIVAALLCQDSQVVLKDVGLNPTRDGLITTLKAMGGQITYDVDQQWEPRGTIRVESSDLKACHITTSPARMIDEYPILAVAAAAAHGETLFEGIRELRFKESDRIGRVVEALNRVGATCECGEDWMRIEGNRAGLHGGVTLDAHLDHRLAMSFIILGLVCKEPVTVTGAETIATSYPQFVQDLISLGADINVQNALPHRK